MREISWAAIAIASAVILSAYGGSGGADSLTTGIAISVLDDTTYRAIATMGDSILRGLFLTVSDQ
jgi:hypothetical protein